MIWALLASVRAFRHLAHIVTCRAIFRGVSMDPWGDDVPIVHVDNFSYGLLNPVLGGG